MRSKFVLSLLVAFGAAQPALAQPQPGDRPRVERPARPARPARPVRQARPPRPAQARPMRTEQARPAARPAQRAPTVQQTPRPVQQARPADRVQGAPTRRPTAVREPVRRDRVVQQPVQRRGAAARRPVDRSVRDVDRSVRNVDRSVNIDRSVRNVDRSVNIDRSRDVVGRDVHHYHRGGRPLYRDGTWWYGGYGYRSYPYWYSGGYGYPGYGYGYPGYGYGWASWLAPLLGSVPMALALSLNDYPPYGYCQIYVPSGGYLVGGPMGCSYAFNAVPQGGWVLYRPQDNPGIVHGFVFDPQSPGQPVGDLIFDARSGALLQQLPV